MRTKLFFITGFVMLIAGLSYADILTPPAGINGQVQFNRKNSFGADSSFTFSTTTKRVTVSSASVSYVEFSTAGAVSKICFTDGTCMMTAAFGVGSSNASLAYGILYTTSVPSVIQTGISTTPVKLAGFTLEGISSNTLPSASADTITVNSTATYNLFFQYFSTAAIASTGSGFLTFEFRVNDLKTGFSHKNGVLQGATATSDVVGAMTGQVNLSSGDVVSVYIENSTTTLAAIQIFTAQFSVSTIGGVKGDTGATGPPGSGSGASALEIFSNFDGIESSPTASIAIGDTLKLSISASTPIVNVDFSTVASRGDVILNQNFLQAGSTASPAFAYIGSSLTTPSLSLINFTNTAALYSNNGVIQALGNGSNTGVSWDNSVNLLTLGGGDGGGGSSNLAVKIISGSNDVPLQLKNSGSAHSLDIASSIGDIVGYTDTSGELNYREHNFFLFGSGLVAQQTWDAANSKIHSTKGYEWDTTSSQLAGSAHRFYDSGSSFFTQFRSTATGTYDQDYVLFNSTGADDQIPAIKSHNADGSVSLYWKTDATGGYAVESATVTFQLAKGHRSSTGTYTSLSPGVMHIVAGSSNVATGVVQSTEGGTGFSVASDDNVLIGNGSIWESKSIPSCSGATTDKLLYNIATNQFSCGTDQTGGGGGGGTTIWVKEDGSAVDNAVSTMNFTTGLNVTSSPSGQANVAVDYATVTAQGNAVSIASHASRHQDGGADEISVTGLSGLLADPQEVRYSTGGTFVSVSTGLNVIQGTQIIVNGVETGNRFDLTITNGFGADIDLSGAEATGILAAGRFPALTGDVTTSAGSLATTVANVPNSAIDGSSITKQGNTFNAANKLLQLDGSGLVPNARLDSSSVTLLGASIDLSGAEATGTLAAGRFPALTGDVTTTAGSLATTIAADAVALGADTTDIYVGSITVSSAFTLTGTNNVESAAPILSANSSSTTLLGSAIDLNGAEVANTLGVGNGGTGATTLASNGALYGNGSSAVQATAQGGANTVLIANAGAPSFSSNPTVSTLTATTGFFAPASSTHNVTSIGQVAIDTDTISSSMGTIIVHDGTQKLFVVVTTNTPSNTQVPKYNSSTGKVIWDADATGAASGYQTIQDEGSALTQRTTVNFTGSGVSCVDNSGSSKTDCTIAGGGGGSSVSSFTYTFNAAQADPKGSASYISNSTSAASAGVFFDDTSTQTCVWATTLTNYNGNQLKADVIFTSTATSGTMNWGVYIECKTTNVDALDYDTDSFSTINSTSVTVGATSNMAAKATATLSNGDSCADGDTVRIKLERSAGSLDTAVGFGRVRFLRLYE